MNIWCNSARNFFAATIVLLAALAVVTQSREAFADTFTTLHEFCAKSRCKDGIIPTAAFTLDPEGNLFGSTPQGGLMDAICQAVEPLDSPGCGVIFELKPNANRMKWTEHVLYKFCSQPNCADGFMPVGALTRDKDGNFFGTTGYGGAHNGGVAFELTPNADKTQWTETVLHDFCSANNCADGVGPGTGLLLDELGNLYGATKAGGANQAGTVFELTPNTGRTQWTETVIYSFCSVQAPPSNCADGRIPQAITADEDGNLYGTTLEYDVGIMHLFGTGTVFKLAPNDTKTQWTETTLFKFCVQSGRGVDPPQCPTPGPVSGDLVVGAKGALYGMTRSGGATHRGVVFELRPGKAGAPWLVKDLHDFCSQPGCDDGRYPEGGLIKDNDGDLFGATSGGGSNARGTVFELTRKNSHAASPWSETVLHDFSSTDGSPHNPLVMDQDGNLYGATRTGALNTGVAFMLQP